MEDQTKCSNEEHKEINAIIFCPECQLYMCNKCENHHATLHKKHHPKEMGWVGYIVEFDGVIYYVAGDSDVTSYSKNVKCDVAFLPVGGTYTMDCIEASNLCNIIKPKIAIPIHYGYVVGSLKDAEIFKKRLSEDIQCKIFIKDIEK